MQAVFVHGVNTRDLGDGAYDKAVAARNDRLNRLALGGNATVHSPYWGKYGQADKALASLPKAKGAVQALGSAAAPTLPTATFLELARQDFSAIVATLSAAAIAEVSAKKSEDERRKVEDYWMAAVEYAEERGRPSWLAQVTSEEDFANRLSAEVEAKLGARSLGGAWLPALDDWAAGSARNAAAGFLSQFLGDALMFFSRRDASENVRREVTESIVKAAAAAAAANEALVVIGHSMGGGVLHELLTDADAIAGMEKQLGRSLKVDVFLSVGTQIGLFAELNLFGPPTSGSTLAVPVSHYWNIYDYTDTLAFLCGPVLQGVEDLEVNTAAGAIKSHVAYFDNALFFHRLNLRLKKAGLVA